MADNQEKFYELFDLEEQEAYVLPAPTLKRVSAMMELQVRSSELPNQIRFHRIQEYGFSEMIVYRDTQLDDEGNPREDRQFMISDPDLSKMEYVKASAKLLFPNAPVDANEDDLNVEVVLEAVTDFLVKATGSNSKLLPLLGGL